MSEFFIGFGDFDCREIIWRGVFHSDEDLQNLRDMLSIEESVDQSAFCNMLAGNERGWGYAPERFLKYSDDEKPISYKMKWMPFFKNNADPKECFEAFDRFIESVPEESTNSREKRFLTLAHRVCEYLDQIKKCYEKGSVDPALCLAAGMYVLAAFFVQNKKKGTPQFYRPPKEYDPLNLAEKAVVVPQVTMNLPEFRLPAIPLQSDNYMEDSRKEEVTAISQALTADNKAVFISGVGGIGKSSVAIDVANKAKEYFKDSYWITYQPSSEKDIENMENTILKAAFADYTFQPDGQQFKGISEEKLHRKLIETELAERFQLLGQNYQDSLIVIDNFDDPTKTINELQKENSYSTLLNLGIKLLFTTRSPVGYEIKALDEQYLMQLMRRYCTEEETVSDEQLKDFIRITDGHTLTCELIAKTLSESWGDVTADDILKALKNSTLGEGDYPEVQNDKGRLTDNEIRTAQIYEHLKALFDVSALDECHQNVMRYAALLPADGMDAKLFTSCLEKEEVKAVKNLEKRGWLKHSQKGNLLTIHPMIREVVFEELVRGREDACRPFLNNLYEYYEDDSQYAANNNKQVAELSSIVSDKVLSGDSVCAHYAGRLFSGLGNHEKALFYFDKAKRIEEQKTEIDILALASAYHNLGSVYILLWEDEKALLYLSKAKELREQELPVDDIELAMTYSNLGLCYMNHGNVEQALLYLHKAREIRELKLTKNHLHTAQTYFQLGIVYDDLCDFDQACYYYDEARKVQEEKLPANHPDIAATYCSLGSVYRSLGDTDKALCYLNKARQIQEMGLKLSDLELAATYHNLGLVHRALNNIEDSLYYLEKAMKIREKELAPNHPDIASSYYNIAAVFLDLSYYSQALSYLFKAKEIQEQISSKWYPELADTYYGIGCIYSIFGDHDTAITYLEKSIENPDIPRYELYKQRIEAIKKAREEEK